MRGFLRVWSYILKESLMENFMFSAVKYAYGLKIEAAAVIVL